MALELSDIIYLRGHLHLTFRSPIADGFLQLVPGFADEKAKIDMDLKFVDRDDDGDADVEVRWDLPGTALDSGADPVTIKAPLGDIMGDSIPDLVSNVLDLAGAPGAVVALVKSAIPG